MRPNVAKLKDRKFNRDMARTKAKRDIFRKSEGYKPRSKGKVIAGIILIIMIVYVVMYML